MTLKNAALFALLGMILLTIVLTVDFIQNLTGFLHDVVAPIPLLASFIRAFAALSLAVFFYVFHKGHVEKLQELFPRA